MANTKKIINHDRDLFYVWAFRMFRIVNLRKGDGPTEAFARAIITTSCTVPDKTIFGWKLTMKELSRLRKLWLDTPAAKRPSKIEHARLCCAAIEDNMGVKVNLRAWEIDALMEPIEQGDMNDLDNQSENDL